MDGLIDPPSPFDSLVEWEQFLAEMESIEDKSDEVLDAIDLALSVLGRSRPQDTGE